MIRWLVGTAASRSFKRRRPTASFLLPMKEFSGQRRFSTEAPEEMEVSIDDLVGWTTFVTNTRAIPYGMLSRSHWQQAFSAIDDWLSLDSGSAEATYWADQILKRIRYEHATLNPRFANTSSRLDNILERQRSLFAAWLSVAGELSTDLMYTQEALAKAQDLLCVYMNSLDRANLVWDQHEDFIVDGTTVVLQSWLTIPEEGGVRNAAAFLLDITQNETINQALLEALQPWFEEVASRSADDSIYVDLVQRMVELKSRHDLQGLILPAESKNVLLQKKVEKYGDGWWQDRQLQSDFQRFLEHASASHLNMVVKMVSSVPSNVLDSHMEFVLDVFQFYARVKEAALATSWLLSMETVLASKEGSANSISSCIATALDIWLENTDARNPDDFAALIDLANRKAGDETRADFVPYYNHLFRLLLDQGENKAMQARFGQMMNSGLDPDARSLSLFIQSIVPEESKEILKPFIKILLRRMQHFPDDDICTVLDSILTSNIPARALEIIVFSLFDDFAQRDHAISASVGDRMVELVERSDGDLDRSEALSRLGKIETLRASSYGIILNDLLSAKDASSDDIISISTRLMKNAEIGDDAIVFVALRDSIFYMTATARTWYEESLLLLKMAEETILRKFGKAVPTIPIEAYERTMSRSWYTSENAKISLGIFERVQELYNAGYSFLCPNMGMRRSYLQCKAVTCSIEEVEQVFDDIIMAFLEKKLLDPDVVVFEIMIEAFQQSDVPDRYEKASGLLQRMQTLGIAPTTNFLNKLMQIVLQSEQIEAYDKVQGIIAIFDKHQLTPDSNTLHTQLIACGEAKGEVQARAALGNCLRRFGEIRRTDAGAEIHTYTIMTKNIRRLIPKERGSERDQIAGAILKLCCEDGLLTPQLRDNFKRLMSIKAWRDAYFSQRLPNNKEPPAWSANIGK